MPRLRDFAVDDDPSVRRASRKGGPRQAALADPFALADDLDDAEPFAGGRRRARDVGLRRHLSPESDPFAGQDKWTDDPRAEDLRRGHKPRRADGSESFKCGHCKAFIGPTVAGGRHRNHCPLCLYSRHVDDRQMGDRASACRALMAPVGVFYRPKGEQVVVHRCLGCGFERHNRVAADDNFLVLAELPEVPPRGGRGGYPDDPADEEG